LLLAVADSGIGIPPSDQARMFEKFERGMLRIRVPGSAFRWSRA